jgi:LacI family transcriptional regulator
MKTRTSPPVIGIRMATWARYTHDIYRGILQYRRLHQTWQIQTPIDTTNEIEPVRINRFWKGDGLIAFRLSTAEMRTFESRGMAVVSISSESHHHKIPLVLPDYEESGRIVARHFLSLGLRNFAYWGDPSRRYSRARGRGFEQELELAKAHCHQLGIEVSRLGKLSERWRTLRQFMDPQLIALPKPIGILAKDDIAAATLIQACQRLGFRVPDEVAVAGVNNDELFCYTTSPPLTAVRYPGEAIGFRAAAILDQLMQGDSSIPKETIIPVGGLVERESTDILHIADPVVANALRRIRRDAPTYALQVNELVAESPLSRAAFKRRFVQTLGYAPKAEIKRMRLATLKEHLRTTDWSVKRIASHMGFESMEDLGRFMRRETGTTATAFRTDFRLSSETPNQH